MHDSGCCASHGRPPNSQPAVEKVCSEQLDVAVTKDWLSLSHFLVRQSLWCPLEVRSSDVIFVVRMMDLAFQGCLGIVGQYFQTWHPPEVHLAKKQAAGPLLALS